MPKPIYINNKRYYFYERYDSYQEALKIAKQKQKRSRTKSFILIRDKGYWFPYKTYELYFTKIIRLL